MLFDQQLCLFLIQSQRKHRTSVNKGVLQLTVIATEVVGILNAILDVVCAGLSYWTLPQYADDSLQGDTETRQPLYEDAMTTFYNDNNEFQPRCDHPRHPVHEELPYCGKA